MDLIFFFTNVGPNLAKQITLPKEIFFFFIILEKNLIKVCF